MIHHVLGLFTHPDEEWKEIKGEDESIGHICRFLRAGFMATISR